jgi:2-oxoisovalerate dehydrogenase E2 component (dihydrolipoyl transacylase)
VPQFKLPDPGEGLVEAEIVTWKVKVGDTVRTNDIVVEVETAKSLVELPIPYDGVVRALLAQEGDTVEVGTPIIDVDDGSEGDGSDGGGSDEGAAPAEERAGTVADVESGAVDRAADVQPDAGDRPDDLVPEPEKAPAREAILVGYGASEGSTTRRRRRGGGTAVEEPERPGRPVRALAKPPVRKYAKDRGVDITQVRPSSPDGVVSRADVDQHLAAGAADTAPAAPAMTAAPAVEAPAAPQGGTGAPAYSPPSFDRSGERETRTPIKGVRKMTAQAMTSSSFTAPHVTEFVTVDVSATMELVERLKGDRDFRDLKVSPLLILAKALTIAVRRNPGMIAVWDEQAQEIVQRHYVNLGIAAATPRGLVVPNIKDADLMDLRQLAEALADLVATAKAGRTQPAQMSGGTITITNVGVFGVDTGTPIINPGESAIVCFGAIRKQPWVVTNAAGEDEIVPRWVTQLAVSFDHRLIDGELGSRFLADLAALLEDPSRALVWG